MVGVRCLESARPSTAVPIHRSGILVAPRVRCSSLISGVRTAIALCFVFEAGPTSVLAADAQIRGSRENLRIEARDTSIEEILTGLENALNVHHRSSTQLDNRLNGTFEGSAVSVIKRVLDGYDFFVKTADSVIEVTVLRQSTGTLRSTASPAFRISDQPIEVIPAQRSPAPAAAEPHVPSDSASVKPAQPPAPAAGPHVRSASAAPSFRKRHRDHSLAIDQGSRPPPPRKTRLANKTWRGGNSHPHSKRVAHRSICCRWNSPFFLGETILARTPSCAHWEILFDRPGYWLRQKRRRAWDRAAGSPSSP